MTANNNIKVPQIVTPLRTDAMQRSVADMKRELRELGHSELEITQLMSRTLYRKKEDKTVNE